MLNETDFEYLDFDSVDKELICSICIRPFCSPLCAPQCGHTFCQACIEQWLKDHSCCPTCRHRVKIRNCKPVKSRALINQLSRLLVKCTLCEQNNIIDRNKHIEICPKKIIKCPSSDHHCQWNGKREELELHLKTCPFQQLRPIIDQLINELKTIKETQIEQQRFIQAFINNGHTLSKICTAASACHLKCSSKSNRMLCSVCNQKKRFEEIKLHSCETITGICESCFDKNTSHAPRSTRKRKLSSSEESDNDDSDFIVDNDDDLILDDSWTT